MSSLQSQEKTPSVGIKLNEATAVPTTPENEKAIDDNTQFGVQAVEAVTLTWTTGAIVAAYAFIWLAYFAEGILSGVTTSLSVYVTSAFAEHSLTATVSVLASVIGGVSNVTIGKILDVFGRPQGYLFCVVLAVMGLIMMAACRTVEAYAAAQVFYTVGNSGLQYTLGIFIADTSSLRNRGLMQAFLTSPSIITCWLGGPISSAFLAHSTWRWCFGAFCFIIPGVALPLYGLFLFNYRKAKAQGILPRKEGGEERRSARAIYKLFVHHCIEFDIVGILLLSGGVALFLLPFNLYTMQTKGWASPLIICLLVFGVVFIVLFSLWERFFARVTLIPYSLLIDRTVLGACLLGMTLFISYYCWASYFTSFLMVVNNLSVTKASYVVQTYTVGGCLCSIFAGGWIRHTNRFKPIALYFGIPLSILGQGLMIYFRQPDVHIGYIVMCQIFISFAEGVIVICDEIAIMAASSHQYIAMVIAVLSLCSSMGGAIGLTIASAIWQGVFPVKLAEYLPSSELPNLELIYGDITTQLSYPVGSEARLAIQHAYGDAQKLLLIAGTAVWILGLAAVLMWRNINVSNVKQTKGNVV